MSPKLLILAALTLSACGGDDADTATPLETAVTPEPIVSAPAASSVTVQETVDAIGTDITAMPLAAANQNIDGWIATLQNADFEQADALVEGLETLKTQLAAAPIDGKAVAGTLSDLGGETTAAAVGAEGEAQAGLITLRTALTNAGNVLSGVLVSEED